MHQCKPRYSRVNEESRSQGRPPLCSIILGKLQGRGAGVATLKYRRGK
jgi:hypothetical protein